MQAQPDNRIQVQDLGTFWLNGTRYMVHARPGCPRNATIEIFQGYLRCWACKKPLSEEAANFARDKALPRDNPGVEKDEDVFVWKNGDHRAPKKRLDIPR